MLAAVAALIVASLAGGAAAGELPVGGPLAEWNRLLPDGWVPDAVREPLHLEELGDDTPEAAQALAQLRAAWDVAPINPHILGRPIRLFGYLVPVEPDARETREFVLVPYFEGCIHQPPPPANQMVRVVATAMLSGLDRGVHAFWITGRLVEERTPTRLGAVAYRLVADAIEPYRLASITPRAAPD
ncbi:MAG: DUF3299 domain-containing protein [Burkholderiaceae bacterium]